MFDSGPQVSCYTAVSIDDGSFAGVRCVLFANFAHHPEAEGVAFVWYAEGRDARGPFRHFGEAFLTGAGTVVAHAAAITGNGERDEPFQRLRFDESPSPQPPSRLTVTGDRRESWTLVPDGVVAHYSPLPRHVERTGPRMVQYAPRSTYGTPGFGVRSTLSSGSWLGAGRWLDRTYVHLGTYLRSSTGLVQFGTADILAGNFYCGGVPWGEVTVRDDPASDPPSRVLSGAWSEVWELRGRANGWYPDPEIAHIVLP